MLGEETQDLVSASLHDKITLYLEQGAKAAPDSVLLNIIAVRGNSTESKYSLDEAGERGLEIEITAGVNETIQEVRDRAGVLLFGYTEGWTHRCNVLTAHSGVRNHLSEEVLLAREGDSFSSNVSSSNALTSRDDVDTSFTAVTADVIMEGEEGSASAKSKAVVEFGEAFKGLRFRKTSWLKEPNNLLEEMVEESHPSGKSTQPQQPQNQGEKNKTKSSTSGVSAGASSGAVSEVPAVRAVTVKDSGLKGGDTLLLEEGVLPIKSQMTLQVIAEFIIINIFSLSVYIYLYFFIYFKPFHFTRDEKKT